MLICLHEWSFHYPCEISILSVFADWDTTSVHLISHRLLIEGADNQIPSAAVITDSFAVIAGSGHKSMTHWPFWLRNLSCFGYFPALDLLPLCQHLHPPPPWHIIEKFFYRQSAESCIILCSSTCTGRTTDSRSTKGSCCIIATPLRESRTFDMTLGHFWVASRQWTMKSNSRTWNALKYWTTWDNMILGEAPRANKDICHSPFRQ